ncbi:MAG TPA: hypothetical protein VHR86_03275, partial [Armatimonadota bacterium]|nr:hypothetical protein [Armatimonadota bacterium]
MFTFGRKIVGNEIPPFRVNACPEAYRSHCNKMRKVYHGIRPIRRNKSVKHRKKQPTQGSHTVSTGLAPVFQAKYQRKKFQKR